MVAAGLKFLFLDPLVDAQQKLRAEIALREDALQVGEPLLGRHAVLDVGGFMQISIQHDNCERENEDRVS